MINITGFRMNHQFGLFLAFSAGWRLSQEQLVRNNLPVSLISKITYKLGQTVIRISEIITHTL